MEVIKTNQQLFRALEELPRPLAFVPTMGALHDGHLSLVRLAHKHAASVVVSIFVNPTQFNDKKDLEKYPRTLESDCKKLESVGTDLVYAPSVGEVYPPGLDASVQVDFGTLTTVMEGRFRPGHFDGMASVVHRLLDLVRPDLLIMGQKDFQQFTIVRHMIAELNLPVRLVIAPIKREKTGLAMSSRNERLDASTRREAAIIYKVLKSIKRRIGHRSIAFLKAYADKKLNTPPFRLEYLEMVDGRTLLPLNDVSQNDYAVACIAVYAGEVRLIDNIVLRQAENDPVL